ncbi:MAG: hypothetical protein WDZ44_02110, partial [Candidatus Spechtbacterales bacterium]
ERIIEVRHGGVVTTQQESYAVSEELNSVAGNDSGFTTLLFADEGRGALYADVQQNVFLSGARADEAVAQFVARQLLEEYFGEDSPSSNLDVSPYYSGGGLSLFAGGDDDLEFSAKAVDALRSSTRLSSTAFYFRHQMENELADIHRTSRALYGLASLRERVLPQVYYALEEGGRNTDDTVYLALAALRLGDRETARVIYLEQLRSHNSYAQEGVGYLAGSEGDDRITQSGMAATLASSLGFAEDARSLWSFVQRNNPVATLDVIEESLFMQAELARLPGEDASFTLVTNERRVDVELEKGRAFRITLSAAERSSVSFDDVEGSVALISTFDRLRSSSETPQSTVMSITREYENMTSGGVGTSFPQDVLVRVRIVPRLSAAAPNGYYQVVDQLPAGLRPLTNAAFQPSFYRSEDCLHVGKYPTRVLNNTISFTVHSNFIRGTRCGVPTIEYYARVVQPGVFIAPPTLIQSLENISAQALSGDEDTITIGQ